MICELCGKLAEGDSNICIKCWNEIVINEEDKK